MNVRFLLAGLGIWALAVGTATAQNNQVRKGAVPDWVTPSELLPVPADAGGLIFVRRQDALVHLDSQGQSQYFGYRMKILHPNALQFGNLAIAWNPAAGAPIVHTIKVYRDGEAIDLLSKAVFEILRREDQLEAARLDGTLTGVFRIPDLRVGDELEIAFTTRSSDPTLGKHDSGLLALAPDPSPGRFRLGLSWDKAGGPPSKSHLIYRR